MHRSRTTNSSLLAPDASNLPGVLAYFAQRDRRRYDRLVELMRSVFGEIRDIISENLTENEAGIFVHSLTDDLSRDDLRTTLDQCGTGIGQVLAMLYVIISSQEPRIILIDEPQSFLYPGAVRKLLEIFEAYPQHQYIITSHWPVVLADARDSRLVLVRRDGFHSEALQLDPAETRDLRHALSEVGARLSDVFGMDSILWVEGATEEECCPIVLRHFKKPSIRTTRLLGLLNTRDLRGRDKTRTAEIYKRLSNASVLMPSVVALLLDREGLTDGQLDKLREALGDELAILPRRMFENYLLAPSAIATLLNELCRESQRQQQVTPDEVTGSIIAASELPDFRTAVVSGDILNDEVWLETVHGANLLQLVFKTLTDGTIEYRKREHGLRLVEKILSDQEQLLAPVAQFVDAVIMSRSSVIAGEAA